MVEISLLGGLRVTTAGTAVALPLRHQTRDLWAFLLMRPGDNVPRSFVAGQLWPDVPEAEAQAKLRRNLHWLRAYLADLLPDVDGALAADRSGLRWTSDASIRLDVNEFEAAARAALAELPASRVALAAADALYAGELLPGLDGEWAESPRERLRALHRDLLERLIRLSAAAGELDTATGYAERLLAADPAREDIHRLLIWFRAAAGDRPAAQRQYERCVEALAAQVGLPPSRATSVLFEAVRDGQPDAVIARLGRLGLGTLAVAGPTVHRAPRPATELVGRGAERAEVDALVAQHRLVTLVGPGGTGKTRLALAVAEARAEAADGVWWVDLAPVTTPSAVPAAVATALGLPDRGGQTATERVVAHLASRAPLIVLDNCEHVTHVARQLARDLLAGSAGVRLLATSRELLGVEESELVWPVPPLPVPAEATQSAETLRDIDAVRLFLERATDSRPGYAAADADLPAVVAVCRRLDGLPLVIELAAALMAAMSPEEIAARLDRAMGLLVHGRSSSPERHRTLRAVLDWSHDLLEPGEQVLLRRLAVFRGDFSLESAEDVCSGSGGATARDLAALAAKSLVATVSGAGHSTRYRLLETVRLYAAEHLAAADEIDDLSRRHAAHYRALAEAAAPHVRGSTGSAWLDRLEAELANLRAALDWSARHDVAGLLGFAAALWRFWYVRGHMDVERALLEAVLGNERTELPLTSVAADALLGAGALAYSQGDYRSARRHFERSLELGRRLGDNERMVASLGNVALVCNALGDLTAAHEAITECLALCQELNDPVETGKTLITMGDIRYRRGELAAAGSAYAQALAACEGLPGASISTLSALRGLGNVARRQGDLPAAIEHNRRALEMSEAMGYREGVAGYLNQLGYLAYVQGDLDEADRYLTRSAEIYGAIGGQYGLSVAINNLGEVALQRGDIPAARSAFERTLALRRACGDVDLCALPLFNLATTYVRAGDPASAGALLDEALAIAERTGDSAVVAQVRTLQAEIEDLPAADLPRTA